MIHRSLLIVGSAVWACLRSAWWAWQAGGAVRGQLRDVGGVWAEVPQPVTVARGAQRGARAGLRLRRASCLEASIVLQRWLLEDGDPREVVIGVARKDGKTTAHAWLAGEESTGLIGYIEMMRLPPR